MWYREMATTENAAENTDARRTIESHAEPSDGAPFINQTSPRLQEKRANSTNQGGLLTTSKIGIDHLHVALSREYQTFA